MSRRNIVSTINAIARAQARQQRQEETELKRSARENEKKMRDIERGILMLSKSAKQRHIEVRVEETDDLNEELKIHIDELQNLLESTLSIDDTINFESLRIRDEYTPLAIPEELSIHNPPPDKQTFLSKVKKTSFLENTLGLKGRYQRELQVAEEQYVAALKAYQEEESARETRLSEIKVQDEINRKEYELNAQRRNLEVDELETTYKNGDTTAVITYNSMVLERSMYPEGFPQLFRLAYNPESKEIVIEYELPEVSIIPSVAEFKYIKSKDAIEEKQRRPTEIKQIYQDIIASVSLRSIHEVLEADNAHNIEVVAFNGYVQSVDKATGKDVRPCIISLRTTREKFEEINLSRIDKLACLRNLGAQVSPQPQALQPVKPVIEFNMVDRRFIEQGEVLSDLESRPNLMDLTPANFESLVSNLFGKMGLETKLTRTSRDGGVDAVAFDTRPILGGKVVIQAKRYKNTVGVSAVRDLYGTMLNEGASKGIIVTTSSYGPDAYNFSKDKPLELIDGGGLLYLLDQVGIKARIVFPDED